MSLLIPRRTYADLYGPTKGDRIRLADTDSDHRNRERFHALWRRDYVWRRQVIRDGMGQSSTALRESQSGALDLVITNAVILDHWGIVKGDIGIKTGRIVKKWEKPGSRHDGRRLIRNWWWARATEVIAGEHLIVTAGGSGQPTFISFRRSRCTRRFRMELRR